MTDDELTPGETMVLRSLVAMLRRDYEQLATSHDHRDSVQTRGLRLWDWYCSSVRLWARTRPDVRLFPALDKGKVMEVHTGRVAFVVQKAGIEALASLAAARLPWGPLERRRVGWNRLRRYAQWVGWDGATRDDRQPSVERFVSVVHVGDRELLQVFVGVRTGRRSWSAPSQVFGTPPADQGAGTVVPFDQQERLALPEIEPLDGVDPLTRGRFDDATPDELDVPPREEPESEEESGGDEGA